MATNYRRMNTPDLIAKRSAKRVTEAEYRLAEWDMSAKNVRRLEAFVAGTKAPAKTKTAPPAKAIEQAEVVSDDLKAKAQEVWKAVFAIAPDGQRKRSAGKAYGLVMRGHNPADVLANVDALLA